MYGILGWLSADDVAVWDYARQFGFAIISKDIDFSQRSYLFGAPPKIISIRIGNCSTREIEEILRSAHQEIERFSADPEEAIFVINTLGAISSIAHDEQSNVLEVELRASGEICRYFDVPVSVYQELLKSESKERYVSFKLKSQYRFEKIL